jgi:hypothetical protein
LPSTRISPTSTSSALELHTLGAEILGSMRVFYGKDATEVYAEGTAAGLLPKIGDMDPLNRTAMFLVMHTQENRRPPEVSYKSTASAAIMIS